MKIKNENEKNIKRLFALYCMVFSSLCSLYLVSNYINSMPSDFDLYGRHDQVAYDPILVYGISSLDLSYTSGAKVTYI